MNEHAFPTNLASMIESILLDPAFDRDDARESRAEAILDLLTRLKVDWQNALDVFFHVLLDGSMKQSWQHVLESTWLALGKIKDFPASMIDYTIAVIYHCV